MNVSDLWKRLRKRLKRKKRTLSLAGWLLVTIALAVALRQPSGGEGAARPADLPVASGTAQDGQEAADGTTTMSKERLADLLSEGPSSRTVVLHRQYVCGEEVRDLGVMSRQEIVDRFAEHPDWTVSLSDDGGLSFWQQVDDLSPACKETAYFGLDEQGHLTLFDGLPKNAKVIRTFFQLDIAHLESRLPAQVLQSLHDGIRIRDMAEFNSVLSTFSEYVVDAKKS